MIYLPVKNSGMETKKPAMAQTLVEAAPFKYLLVLKNEKLFLWSTVYTGETWAKRLWQWYVVSPLGTRELKVFQPYSIISSWDIGLNSFWVQFCVLRNENILWIFVIKKVINQGFSLNTTPLEIFEGVKQTWVTRSQNQMLRRCCQFLCVFLGKD